MSNYSHEDKYCKHCGGNLSPHSCGEFGGVKIWCDDCGSNNPDKPPSVVINEQPMTPTLPKERKMLVSEITEKDIHDMWNRAKEYKPANLMLFSTSKEVYEKLNSIVNAPWYKKLYWKLCRPFWWVQEKLQDVWWDWRNRE